MMSHNEDALLKAEFEAYQRTKEKRTEYHPTQTQAQIYRNEKPVDLSPEICLNCTEPHCTGSHKCYKSHGGESLTRDNMYITPNRYAKLTPHQKKGK